MLFSCRSPRSTASNIVYCGVGTGTMGAWGVSVIMTSLYRSITKEEGPTGLLIKRRTIPSLTGAMALMTTDLTVVPFAAAVITDPIVPVPSR